MKKNRDGERTRENYYTVKLNEACKMFFCKLISPLVERKERIKIKLELE
jgi:hypothetical protein